MTILMKAVKNNDIAGVKKLIQQGAEINELDSGGDSPMIMAAYLGHTEILRLLLAAGADVTAVDPGMKATALHAAAYAGRTECARLLIEFKIDIDKQGPYNGYTALHDAIWQNHFETAQVIIAGGASLELKSHDGQTPLEFARARKLPELVRLIESKMNT